MSNNDSQIVRSFPELKIAVLGDLMLDRYIWGQATRISQEAPVPVVLVQRENGVPGGAANVVRNVLSLHGQAVPLGIIGNDSDGASLAKLLEEGGADGSGMVVMDGGVTTVKTRIIAGNQQVVRVDKEQPAQVTPALRKQVLERLEEALGQGGCQALIIQDYAKGLFDLDFMREAVDIARRQGVIATLDPHPAHAFNVPGLKLMTPNRMEAFALAGMTDPKPIGDPLHDAALLACGKRLRELWNPELLLITLGAEGMILFAEGQAEPLLIPTKARRVFDVSGAGDTVMATMTLALLAGAEPGQAASIANQAAGIVVGYVGTKAIEAEELLGVLK